MNTTLRSYFLPCILLASALSLQSSFTAEALEGAQSFINNVQVETTKPPAVQKPTTPIIEDIDQFQKTLATLSPEQAATTWVELAQRSVNEPPKSGDYGALQTRWQNLFNALPGPKSWDTLKAQLNKADFTEETKKSQWSLIQFFFAYLTDDKAEQERSFLSFSQTASSPGRQRLNSSFSAMLSAALLKTSYNPAVLKFALDFLLAQPDISQGNREIQISDIATILGEESAEKYLLKILSLPLKLQISYGDATRKVAAKIALKNIDKLKIAQWDLVNTSNALELYPAMMKRFPHDQEHYEAFNHYVTALIAAGNTEKAFKLLIDPSSKPGNHGTDNLVNFTQSPGITALIKAGHGNALFRLYRDILAKNPGFENAWGGYIHLAALLGKQEEMLKFTRETAARTDLSPEAISCVKGQLVTVLLAADKIDEGVDLLLKRITDKSSSQIGAPQFHSALKLIEIGRLLDNSQWIESGVKVALEKFASTDSQSGEALAKLLRKLNRNAEAESVLKKELVRKIENINQISRGGYFYYAYDSTRSVLITLAGLYYKANQPADVITLLNTAPWWGAPDITEFIRQGEPPMGYVVAAALAEQRPQEAIKILRGLLQSYAGYDPAYALLLKLQKEKALPVFDELFRRDAFEERPLIWKAEYYLAQGNLAEAKSYAKQAVTIDPSDGDEGKGDRMRAYSILGKIAEKEGDTKQQEFLAGVIKSIRLSEDADDFYAAGLLTRAVKMYNQALTYFADAYCIQSRLAIQLNKLGRYDEAEEHYRKAYELMPDSFGRMESHCFGCEHAFADAQAQTIAEKVFTKLLKERPDKPQLYYLFGYLRGYQDHYKEALQYYRKAVELDPDYINAWKKIQEMANHIAIPPKDYDESVRNLLRLDPARRHTSVNIDRVSNLAGLWQWLETASAANIPLENPPYYPLTAATEFEKKAIAANPPQGQGIYHQRIIQLEKISTPQQQILQNSVLRSVIMTLSMSR
ncbi:MAG: tetratricopeptide repeat protein [Chthoniobacterales bacterium]